MVKTQEEKPRMVRIPLYEETGKYKHLIGYYYPERSWVVTPNGNWSVETKMSSNGRTVITGNRTHHKRMQAAFNSGDFTYRASDEDSSGD